jgi:DNA-binding PadR family transcriptional regulator
MYTRGHLDLLLLSTLTHTGASHGYALITALRDASEGAFDLPEGTVYPALHRLENDGLIASGWSDEAGRRRRVYSLTADGRAVLAAKRKEWREFAAGMERVAELGRAPRRRAPRLGATFVTVAGANR